MQPKSQEAPGYFVWQAPGRPFSVHLNLDVVDRLSAEIMRGFGAVPKRGAEVGGVLLGSIDSAGGTVVRIDDFEAVTCEYRRGPSFYLTESEQDTLGSAASGARPGKHGLLQPVGYYRSHTRDGETSLGDEDLEWLESYFPDPNQVALLVKPFATKVSIGGFLIRENGTFPGKTPLEFPFRRREMLGEDAPPRRSMYERRPRTRERRERDDDVYESRPAPDYGSPPRTEYPQQFAQPPFPTPEPTQYNVDPYPFLRESADPPSPTRHWMWLPMALVILALGMAIGYQGALTFGSGEPPPASTFAMRLSSERAGNSLSVKWDRDSVAIQRADRGTLEISDGDFQKTLPLDPAQLKEGTVVYQNMSPLVQFRLTVFFGTGALTETVDWRQ